MTWNNHLVSYCLYNMNSYKSQRLDVSSAMLDNDCCDYDLFDREEDVELIDKAFMDASELSVNERSMLFYVSGYVAKNFLR